MYIRMIDKIICGDALEVLDMIEDNSVHLCFTSPPYNAGHRYDWYDDNLSEEDYDDFLYQVFEKIHKKLVHGWRLAVNIPFAIKNMETKRTMFVSTTITNIAHKLWFLNFEIITWHKWVDINHFQWNNTAWWSRKSPSNPVCRPMSEAIFIFSKWQTRLEGNKEDIDITSEEFKNWTKNSRYFWEWYAFENLLCMSNLKKKKDHPATFPTELAERIIKLYSYKWNTILDPFNGLWNTTIAAKNLERHFIGIDQSLEYCKKATIDMWLNEDTLIRIQDDIVDVSELINTKLVKDEFVNQRFYLKESYSEDLIKYVIDNYYFWVPKTILDPFAWAWTTNLYAIKNNIQNIWFEINPVAFWFLKSKCTKYTDEDIKELKKFYKTIDDIVIEKHNYPERKPMPKYISQEINNTFFSVLWEINKLKLENIKTLLLNILLSLLESVGNYKKDGNWIKFKDNKTTWEEYKLMFIERVKLIIDDIIKLNKKYKKYPNTILIHDSSVESFDNYDISSIDAVITSPPYVNMFDYFESNKIELWMSWYVKDYDEWREYKKSAMRSNMNSRLEKNDTITDNDTLNKVLKKISNKIKDWTIKEKRTVTMLNNYFYDMKKLLHSINWKLNFGWIVCIVVANSAYWWDVVETDKIIGEIGESIWLKVVDMVVARQIRASSQQAKLIDKEKMRESILIFKK